MLRADGVLVDDAQAAVWRTRPTTTYCETRVRQDMQAGGLRPPIRDRDFDEHVIGGGFGIFDEYVEVALVIEDARIEQLKLRRAAIALPVFFDQLS